MDFSVGQLSKSVGRSGSIAFARTNPARPTAGFDASVNPQSWSVQEILFALAISAVPISIAVSEFATRRFSPDSLGHAVPATRPPLPAQCFLVLVGMGSLGIGAVA